jgi:hypothetical protein
LKTSQRKAIHARHKNTNYEIMDYRGGYILKKDYQKYVARDSHLEHINKALVMNLKNQKDYRERAEKDGNPNFNKPELMKERDNLIKQRKKIMMFK